MIFAGTHDVHPKLLGAGVLTTQPEEATIDVAEVTFRLHSTRPCGVAHFERGSRCGHA
jgi:hypothetical protein